MATRKPLVSNAGDLAEIPAGDQLSVAGVIESTSGGFKFPNGTVQTTAAVSGGVLVQTVDVVVASVGYDSVTVNVNSVGMLDSSVIQSWLVPNADFDVDDLIGVSVYAESMTDSIAVTFIENGPIVGTYTINYVVS